MTVTAEPRVYLELVPGEKRPAASGWTRPDYRGIDPDQYERVGLRCDGLVVIDCDSEDAAQRWLKIDPAATFTVKTPRGWHIYYEWTPGSPTGPMVGVYPGIDVRAGNKSQVVCKGDGYEALTRPEVLRPFQPRWLQPTEPVDSAVWDGCSPIPEGTRDDTLYRWGCRLRGEGMELEEILAELLYLNDTYCRPPLPKRQVLEKAKQACQHEAGPELIQTTTPPVTSLETITSRELARLELPKLKWVLPGIIPEGLTLLAARPKKGKSWFALNLALAVATGGAFLDTQVPPGEVLFLALEDNRYRMQSRQAIVLGHTDGVDNLEFCLYSGKMPEAATAVASWIEAHPATRLVVVDTLAKVKRARKRDEGLYEHDYSALEPLKELADRYRIAIIVITHTNQAQQLADDLDAVTGSSGTTGGVDNVLLMKDLEHGTLLYGRGRDIPVDPEVIMSFDADRATWMRSVLQEIDPAAELLAWADNNLKPGEKVPNSKDLRELAKMSQSQIKTGLGALKNHPRYEERPHRGAVAIWRVS